MRRVFLLIYRIVGNVSDAQDLTQEAFIKALQRQDQLKDLDKAAHWLSRIASNTAIDFLRRSGRVSFSELDEMPEPVAVSAMESPEQMVLRTERREYLEAGLDILTDRERTGAAAARRGRSAGRRSGRALELLQGDGALAHRQRARETAETFRAAAEAGSGMTHPLQADLALYSTGDSATLAPAGDSSACWLVVTPAGVGWQPSIAIGNRIRAAGGGNAGRV